jgi:pSer/pThr/pTyr-binding forkhead associated (FHA) protein
VFLNGKRVRKHRIVPGDVIKIGMHEITYTRYEPAPADDYRTTETTVLTDADRDVDQEEGAQEPEDEPDDGSSSYSSIARGS